MRIERLAAVAVACLMAGCGGERGGSTEEPTLFAEWRANGDGGQIFTPHQSVWTKGLVLAEDGTGSILLENWQVGALDRVELTWMNAAGTSGNPNIWINAGTVGAGGFDFRFDMGGERVTFTDGDGIDYEFIHVAQGSENLRIAELSAIEPVLSSPIHPMSELVTRNDTSWFEIYGHKLVDLDGTVIAADAIYSHPIASQDGDLWMACNPCDAPTKIQRRAFGVGGALVDEIDLSARILTPIHAGYWDAASLWVLTDTTSPGDLDPHAELWRFDPSDPDGITGDAAEVRYLPLAIDSFTFHDGRLFALIAMPMQVLVELGATQTKSWELPDDVRWQGLASSGDALRLLGAGENEYPVVVDVTNL